MYTIAVDTGTSASLNKAIVYKSMSCGCCDNYVKYLKTQGFDVEVVNLADTSSIKQKYNIPANMQSCHTTVISDYFIEGHMPIEAVRKLLNEKTGISGIALPEMPSGSPGMTGPKTEPYKIYSLNNGIASDFMTV